MTNEKKCPHCGKPVPPTALGDLCPECMLKAGLAAHTEGPGAAGEGGTRFVPPPIGEIAGLFPQLEILRLIGQGGMGAVYKARQPALDRFVALKVLPPLAAGDPGFAERFNREARALARLNHPNIVAVHDFGKAGTLHYLVMEFVDGANLREVERLGELTPEQALTIVPQICEALQFAHNEGIVHRDIKPENLLVDKKGRVKITDFGIAKMVGIGAGQQTLTGAKDVVGTPHYMAPEQIEKPLSVDHRADIYSLGVVFYEMLTGELPLGKFAPPSQKVHIDVRLDEVVLHALEKEPNRRYQQASQVKTAVETIVTTPPGGGPANLNEPVPTAAQVEAARQRLKIPARGLMASVVLQLLFALGLLIFAVPGVARESGGLVGMAVIGFIVIGFLIPTAVVLAGVTNMLKLRRYTFTVVASVVAAVAGPGAILGLPFGIWACVELFRPEVRAAFAQGRPNADKTNPASGVPLFPASGGLVFKSRAALNLARAGWSLGCLGALGFLGSVPGWEWLKCLFGFAGFFGLIGVAVMIEFIHRRRTSADRNGQPVRFGRAWWFAGFIAVLLVSYQVTSTIVLNLIHARPNVAAAICKTIQNEVGRQLREGGASYDSLQVTMAEQRDSGTPFTVSYKGLRHFKYTHDGQSDPNWPASADGQFIMQYIGGSQWQGALGDTQFTVQAGTVDNLNLPFIDDPPVIGEWQSVDFVAQPSDFNPDQPQRKRALFLKGLTFLANGRMQPGWLTWTKGVVMHHGDKTANRYEIREINGKSYLFFEWKSGDSTILGRKPPYYVLKKTTSDINSASVLQFRLVLPKDSNAPADWLPSPSWPYRFRLSRQVLLDDSDIARAGVDFGLSGGPMRERIIEIRFTDTGAKEFEAITATNIGHQLAIVFRGRVLSAPVIQSIIPGGECQITGLTNAGEVNEIVDYLNRTAPPTAEAWRFSPLYERILPLKPSPDAWYGLLDLDSGIIITNSSVDWVTRAGHDWIRAHGLDVVPAESAKHLPGLLGIDMIIAPAPTNGCDIVTAADVIHNWAFQENEPRQMQVLAASPGQTDTFFFQTREGGKGILQILGFADNPPSVKIRYKLVQATAPGAIIDPATGLPTVRGSAAIDPNTGLPVATPSGTSNEIDSTTGLPITRTRPDLPAGNP